MKILKAISISLLCGQEKKITFIACFGWNKKNKMKSYWYLTFAVLVLIGWFCLPYSFEEIYHTAQTRFSPIVMLFGSFIAGVSSEGGGAIAFPVFTLGFEMSPIVARNFSFAIQSIGMTAASLILIDLKVKIHKPALLWGTVGGVVGLILGTTVQTSSLNYGLMKLSFVSLWLSFGVTLYYIFIKKRKIAASTKTDVTNPMKIQIIIFAFIGGIVTAFFGNGIDILIFSLLVLRFNVDIKTATATSIILMTIHTIAGFFLHYVVLQDFGPIEMSMWLACIPVVVLGAPLGSFVLSRIKKKSIAYFLITIIFIQYIGALYVLRPSVSQISYSLIIIFFGLILFGSMKKKNRVINE